MNKNNKIIEIQANGYEFNSDKFYTYELIDSHTSLPFYVGKGQEFRMLRHIWQRNQPKFIKTNPHKINKINKIINTGGKIICKIVLIGTENECFEFEVNLIKKYGLRSEGGLLTNLNRGGEGYRHDGIPVDQFTMWGEYIRTYKNAKEAARINNFKNSSLICSCCKKREKSYMGYLWAYTGETPNLLTKTKPTYQWDLNGKLIKIHKNASQAAKELKCDPSTILDCIAGHIRQALGFLWSRENKVPVLTPNKKNKQVKHINTGIIYPTVTAAAKATKHSVGSVSFCCNRKIEKINKDEFCYVS